MKDLSDSSLARNTSLQDHTRSIIQKLCTDPNDVLLTKQHRQQSIRFSSECVTRCFVFIFYMYVASKCQSLSKRIENIVNETIII